VIWSGGQRSASDVPTVYHRPRRLMVGTLPPSLFALRRDKFALRTLRSCAPRT